MNQESAVESYEIEERFERALQRFRGALAEMDLEVAAEFNGARAAGDRAKRTLLVDSPLLSFEALALDRAAALYFPVHVVVAPAGEGTSVSIVDVAHLLHARLPAGAGEPIERLLARIRMAVEAVSRDTSATNGDGGFEE